MANNTLIRVLTGKRAYPRFFTYQAIIGTYFSRLEKIHGVVEIADPELETKLTKEQLNEVYNRFPHLKPITNLPPEPESLGEVDITPKRKRKTKTEDDGN